MNKERKLIPVTILQHSIFLTVVWGTYIVMGCWHIGHGEEFIIKL